MKKLSIAVQWLVVLTIITAVAYVIVRPPPQPEYFPRSWRSWEGLTILSYAGIDRHDEPMYPSVARLESHLNALHAAGFRTVRLADVRAFLTGSAPLPGKALLLVFEGGRKEAVIRATPLLQRTGFTAVMAVPTAVTRSWSGFYLKPSDIARVARLPQWEMASMGHDAPAPVPVDMAGATGHFLAQRRWTGTSLETPAAFQQRLLDDYARSARILTRAAGRAPLLYLYPLGDAGQRPGADPLAEGANRAGVTRYFDLAIVNNGDPFNGPERDPFALNRLRVPGTWTAERLLQELEHSRPRVAPHEHLGAAEDWVFDHGGRLEHDTLELDAGDTAWLRGTDGWTDVEVEARLHGGPAGIASLYLRYGGPADWLRLSVDAATLRVQERVGGRLQTLARRALPSGGTNADHAVRLRVRNNRAWVWLDGETVAGNLPVSPVLRRGRIGFGSERDTLRATAFAARPLEARLLLANSLRLVPDEKRSRLRAVLPVWFHAGEPVALAETQRQDLLLAAPAGIETIPVIAGVAALRDDTRANDLAEQIDTTLTAADLKPLVRAIGIDAPDAGLAAALRERGYTVVHLLTAAQAAEEVRMIAHLSAEDAIVINETGPAAEAALGTVLHNLPAGRVAVRRADTEFGPDLPTAVMADSWRGKEGTP